MKRVICLFLLLTFFPAFLTAEEEKEKSLVAPFWVLQFRHKHPKHFSFSFSDFRARRGYIGPKIRRVPAPSVLSQRETYWYMIYTLTTRHPEPIRVFIDITAESYTHEAARLPLKEDEKGWYPPRPKRVVRYHDGYYPLVQEAIERKYRRRFWGQADLTLVPPKKGEEIPPFSAPLLGGVNKNKDAILDFVDGSTLRGKITAINREEIHLSEFPTEWNFRPFLRSVLKQKDKIQKTIIQKDNGDSIEVTIKDLVGNEIVYEEFGQSNSIHIDDIKAVTVVVPRSKVPSISYECIAIFKGWDRYMDYLKIYVKGLTNGVFYNVGIKEPPHWSRSGVFLNQRQALLEAEELERHARNLEAQGYKEKAKYLQKIAEMYRNLDNPYAWVMRYSVLILSYERPGDEFYPTLDRLIYKGREWKTYVKIVKMDLPSGEE